MDNNWLVPFKGRNYSMYVQQNFLWRHKSIYIMDNHRAALWCWFQNIQKDKKYNLFHIDRHYDTLYSNIDIWTSNIPNLWEIGIQDYLEFRYKHNKQEGYLFSYQNYLSIFLHSFKNIVDKACFVTHNEGSKPQFDNISEYSIWNVPNNLDYWLSNEENKWIFNLDLDYFFYDEDDNSEKVMFSASYIQKTFEVIAKRYKDGTISVITVALSPEWSGGWEKAEKLCSEFCKILGVNLSFPKSGF